MASPSGGSLEETDFSRLNPDFTQKARIIACLLYFIGRQGFLTFNQF
jgi:hypothetical protein